MNKPVSGGNVGLGDKVGRVVVDVLVVLVGAVIVVVEVLEPAGDVLAVVVELAVVAAVGLVGEIGLLVEV